MAIVFVAAFVAAFVFDATFVFDTAVVAAFVFIATLEFDPAFVATLLGTRCAKKACSLDPGEWHQSISA